MTDSVISLTVITGTCYIQLFIHIPYLTVYFFSLFLFKCYVAYLVLCSL